MNAEKVLMALIRNVICGEELEEDTVRACTPELINEIYPIARRHAMEHVVGHGLSNFHLPESPALTKMKERAMRAVYNQLQMDFEYEQVRAVLQAAKIPFIPLKGTVLKNCYPQPWMRTRCDIDILVKEEQLDAAAELLVSKLNYINKGKHDHDIAFRCPSGAYLELHYDTIQERCAVNNCRDVLANIWEDAKPVEPGSYQYNMSDEMFYFYHIAHMIKHFAVGGCGIRTFLDIWLMNHVVDHDREKREDLLREGGLLKFALAAEKLSECWFSNKDPEEMDVVLGEYILRGNLFNNRENRAALGQVRNGGKFKYLLTRRVFMRYDYLKAEYPILKKHRWLTPVYQVVRWTTLFKGKFWKRAAKEITANMQVDKTTTATTSALVEYLGL